MSARLSLTRTARRQCASWNVLVDILTVLSFVEASLCQIGSQESLEDSTEFLERSWFHNFYTEFQDMRRPNFNLPYYSMPNEDDMTAVVHHIEKGMPASIPSRHQNRVVASGHVAHLSLVLPGFSGISRYRSRATLWIAHERYTGLHPMHTKLCPASFSV